MDRQAALRFHRAFRRGMWIVTALNALWLLLAGAVYAVPLPKRQLSWSVSVEYRDGQPAFVFLTADDKWRLPVELDHIDPAYTRALVALEDKRFYSHAGVDPIAIVRAMWSDVRSMRRVSGGSTLSMQLARLLEPRRRTIPNKVIDMFRAVQLDARMTKREILEQYLARTPYGRNVEGIESAAWSYFGHSAQHLSPLEIATLLAVPQGPAHFAPSGANLERLRTRRDAILHKLIAAGVFSSADTIAALSDAIDTAPPSHLRAMPRQAPHVANWLRSKNPSELHIRTTLDAGAQVLAEHVAALHVDELRRHGIYNGSIVVVDHKTREIVALVGNLDFTDYKHGGQIAMFARPRSPGSTLKPFLYALAIDRGIALPDFLVADVPMEFGTYRPHNFDGDFLGLVTLRESLAKSLNVPFVKLLNDFGVETFVGELERMGVSKSRAKPGELGLSLIAGGMEVTPIELASMYATLAEDGQFEPLRMRPAEVAAPSTIFGRAAGWMTRDALTSRDRPDFPKRRDIRRGLPPEIHWKTGTSFGYRDAWSAGSGPRYTAVVWTGNVDNTPSHELVGSDAAGPMLFDVLEGLADRTKGAVPAAAPEDLVDVEVCAYSGHIATDACPSRIKVKAPLHSVPTSPCPYHQKLEVDRVTHEAVLPACRKDGHDYDMQSFTVLPSEITSWLVSRNRMVPAAPKFAEGCTLETRPPAITLPTEGKTVLLIPGVDAANQQVPLEASTIAGNVTWFVDGALVGSAAATERLFWTPTLGDHTIVVADDAGRKARRKISVRMGQSQIR